MKTASSRTIALAAVVIALVAGYVLAQQATATLGLAHDEKWGDHLVDSAGHSLYLYVLDEDGTSACVDACTNNWPPLTVDAGTEPTAGEGLDAALVGTAERPDGTLQVTYGGHPLYTFRRDAEPGQTRGQRLGDQFYLVSPEGEAITAEVAADVVTLPEEQMAAVMEEGQLVFSANCAVCHGAEGQGLIGPRFVGNTALADGDYVVGRVLNGFIEHGMPPFKDVLSDEQISAVITFVRNSWGNEFGAVLAEEVAAAR